MSSLPLYREFIVSNRIDYAKASPEGYGAFANTYATLPNIGLPPAAAAKT